MSPELSVKIKPDEQVLRHLEREKQLRSSGCLHCSFQDSRVAFISCKLNKSIV